MKVVAKVDTTINVAQDHATASKVNKDLQNADPLDRFKKITHIGSIKGFSFQEISQRRNKLV